MAAMSLCRLLLTALVAHAHECQLDDAVGLMQSAVQKPERAALGATKAAQRTKITHAADAKSHEKAGGAHGHKAEHHAQHAHKAQVAASATTHSKSVHSAVAEIKAKAEAKAHVHAQAHSEVSLEKKLHNKKSHGHAVANESHTQTMGYWEKKFHEEGFHNWTDWKRHRKDKKDRLSKKGEIFEKKEAEEARKTVTHMSWQSHQALPKPVFLTMLNRARLGNRLFQWSALLSIAKEAGAKATAPPCGKYSPTSTPQISNLGELIWEGTEYEWLNTQPNKCHMWDFAYPPTIDTNIENLANWTLAGYPKGEQHIRSAQEPRKGMNWAKMFADAILQTKTPTQCDIVELDGFWQRAEFFVHHLNWLRPTFWNTEVAGQAKEILDRWVDQTGQAGALVGIHLRLGDYIGMGRNLNMQFYRDGLWEVKRRRNVDELTCVVFSDDINLASNVSLELEECTKRIPVYPCTELGKGYHCYQSQRIVNDRVSFYMMSQLPNIIIADSTYSFWSAILSPNEPLVIAPRIVKPERIARRGDYSYLNSDLYEGWVPINTSVGDHTSPAVIAKLNMVQEEDYAAQVRMSEWAA